MKLLTVFGFSRGLKDSIDCPLRLKTPDNILKLCVCARVCTRVCVYLMFGDFVKQVFIQSFPSEDLSLEIRLLNIPPVRTRHMTYLKIMTQIFPKHCLMKFHQQNDERYVYEENRDRLHASVR